MVQTTTFERLIEERLMDQNEKYIEQLEKNELNLRISYMFYQNVKSLCIGLAILFTFFSFSQIFLLNNDHSFITASFNIFTVVIILVLFYFLQTEKLPQGFIYPTVSGLILLVFFNALLYMNFEHEPLWLIIILLIMLGTSIFVLSYRWCFIINTTILVLSIADFYFQDLSPNIKLPIIQLFVIYYVGFIANYLRLHSTRKFQSMYLESQRNQNRMKNVLDEFSQARNFAESINQLVPSAIFTIDLNNRINSWNIRAEKITGYPVNEVLGKTAGFIFKTDIFEIDYSDQEPMKYDVESELYTKSGNLIQISYSIDLLQNDELYGAIVSFEDITERKLAEEKLAKSEEQYRTLQSNIPIGIFRSTYEGHLLSVNPAMVKMFGYDSIEELKMQNVRDLYASKEQRRRLLEKLKIAGKNHTYEAEMKRKDGSTFWIAVNSTAIYQNGVLIYFDGVLEDITQRKIAENNLALRDKILQSLSVSSNIFLTKKNWEESINEVLAKYGKVLDVDRIYIFENQEDEQGNMQMKYAHIWQNQKALDLNISLPKSRIFSYSELGFSEWLKELLERKLIFGNVKDIGDDLEILHKFRIGSIMIVPIFVKDIFWGFIAFDVIDKEREWSQMEAETLTMVAESIGAAINRKSNEDHLKQMYDSLLKELDIASSVQQYLLPDWITQKSGFVFSSTYKPSSLIGGDLFDIIEVNEYQTVVYIGDISGHGVQAALMMTAVKSIINMIISTNKGDLSPSGILQRLNQILSAELFHDNYLTIFLCIIDTSAHIIKYFNAGHPPLIQFDTKTKEVETIDEGGSIPVGWSLQFDYEKEDEGVVECSEDKIFMLYTDGIFECENEQGEQFGMKGFSEFLKEQSGEASIISLPGRFKKHLEDGKYDITTDDFTLLAFRKDPNQVDLKYKKTFLMKPALENVSAISIECFETIKETCNDADLAGGCELVISEFLTNIIRHGIYEEKPEVIGFEFTISDFIEFVFWDKGIAWELPQSNEKNRIATPGKEGGFGMQIIYTMVDEIYLQRIGDTNKTYMRIKIKG